MENGTHELAVDSLYTALTQLMAKKPYEEITISDIAKRAGVSRMAYYRNYGSKDEILTKRLQEMLNSFNAKIKKKALSEEQFWELFFETFEKDDNIIYVVQAGLYKQLLNIHLEFTMAYYREKLGWDMDSEDNQLTIYSKMGTVLGLMIYINKSRKRPDAKKLARLVT